MSMKATISIPDDLFARVDALAEAWGWSRSAIYARAVEELLARHRADDVTERLNAIYATEDSRPPRALHDAQAEVLPDDSW